MVNILIKSKIIKFTVILRRIIVKALIVFLFLELTTYGWADSPAAGPDISPEGNRSETNLKNMVIHLSQKIGIRNYKYYQNLNLAAEYILNQFKDMGYSVEVMTYQINDKEYRNVIAEKPSTQQGNGVIIVGAHYDSCFNPGADDNASGVAGILELARLLKGVDTQSRIQFVAFVNEEPPFFKTDYMGSFVYVSRVKEKKEKIKAAIILESIGFYTEKRNSQRYLPLLGFFYPNKGNFIGVVSNFPSRKILKKIVTSFKRTSEFPIESVTAPGGIPGIDFSDHWSFWKNGYPAVMVTDSAFLRNRNYHKQTDLPSTLNYEKMAEVILGLKESVECLANSEGL